MDNNKIRSIIIKMIDTSMTYENKDIESRIKEIIDIYTSSHLNITKSNYYDINNIIDEQISTFIYSREKRQNILEYITVVSEKISVVGSSKFDKNSQYENFMSFINYVSKYIKNHIFIYSSMLNGIEKTEQTQLKYSSELTEAKDSLEKTKDTMDNLLPNLLTVLSILISIVVAVLIVYITFFLEPNRSDSSLMGEFIQLQFAKYVLSIHVVGDLFFLMMFIIARLTNRTILMSCRYFDWKPEIKDEDKDRYSSIYHSFACADCRCTDCNTIKKLQRKSAYILYFNLLMFVLYAFLYYWWILDYYVGNGKNTCESFIGTSDFYLVVSIAIIIIIGIVCYSIHRCRNRKKAKENSA